MKIEDDKKSGARVLHGDKGYFIQPTIFADTTEDMKMVKEKIFDPVIALSKFSTQAEAITKANDTSYGLALRRLHKE
ncbi:aldehyde dehydrogenase domain-containing protein [Trichoderma austrokoningii]